MLDILTITGPIYIIIGLGLPTMDPMLQSAAMPMLAIYPILAQIYGQEDFSAAALVLTTAASFFTLSGQLLALKIVPA